MKKHNQDGAANVLLVPLVLASLFFVGALSFGYWAYSGRQDYKNNTDQKIAAAVTVAKQQEDVTKDTAFAQAAKQPLKTYSGPEAAGSVVVQYPKTWSAYVDTSSSSQGGLDAYFEPDIIPSITDVNSNYALRIQLVDQAYSSVLSGYSNGSSAGGGPKFTIVPYSLPKVPQAVGVRIDGQIDNNKTGSMIILPVRNATLKIFTQVQANQADFNNIILPNFTFSP